MTASWIKLIVFFFLCGNSAFAQRKRSPFPPPISPSPQRSVSAAVRCPERSVYSISYHLMPKKDWEEGYIKEPCVLIDVACISLDEVRRIKVIAARVASCRGMSAAQGFALGLISSDYIKCVHGINGERPCRVAYLLSPFIREIVELKPDEPECCK